jgi:hypothetical protein
MDEVKEISFYPNNSKSIFRCRIKVYEDNKLKVYDIPYIQFNKDSSISIIKQDDKDTGVFDKNNKIHKNCIFS